METARASATRIRRVALTVAVATLAGVFAGGCGDSNVQNRDAETGTWTVAVTDWDFPKRQHLGTPVEMKITVRNDDAKDIDNLAVTITGLRKYVEQEGQATRTRPVWLRDEDSRGDQTPYSAALADTFDAGPLTAGESKTFKLKVTPLRRGKHAVSYSLSTNVFGGGKAVFADGEPASERRTVVIDPTPNFDESAFD
ncbi:MAG: hypothetical protein WAP35_04820 [Solirubrobacterales bacterium]